eukprot:gene15987-biopygen12776
MLAGHVRWVCRLDSWLGKLSSRYAQRARPASMARGSACWFGALLGLLVLVWPGLVPRILTTVTLARPAASAPDTALNIHRLGNRKCPRHARATPSQKMPTARATPATCPRHCPVPPEGGPGGLPCGRWTYLSLPPTKMCP